MKEAPVPKRNFAIVLAVAWMLPGCTVALVGAVQHSMKSDAPPVAKDQRLADLGRSARVPSGQATERILIGGRR